MAATGTRRRYLDLSWGQAHVEVNLWEEPLILLLHKVTSASSFFRPLITPLTDLGFSVAVLDLPGYGMSDAPPDAEPSLAWYGDACAEVIAALGFESAWVLGHKTGASVAIRAAVDHPEQVTGLLLWSVPYLYPQLEHALATEVVPVYGPGGEDLPTQWRRVYDACSAERAEFVASRELGERLLGSPHQPLAHRALARDDHGPLLAAITQPTAIFVNRDDGLLAETRRAAEAMPSAAYREFDYASGYLTDDHPRELAGHLCDFIRGSS